MLFRSAGSNRLVHLVKGDLTHLPLRDGIFDKAGSFQVFADLPGEDLRRKGIEEIHRVIKPDGIFVITVFNYSMYERLRLFKYASKKEGYHHRVIYYFRFTNNEFRQLLSKKFKVKELCGIRNIPGRPFGEFFRKIGLFKLSRFFDINLEKTPLSYLTGRFLLAKCIKLKE